METCYQRSSFILTLYTNLNTIPEESCQGQEACNLEMYPVCIGSLIYPSYRRADISSLVLGDGHSYLSQLSFRIEWVNGRIHTLVFHSAL
jgi:hypothetical protein